MVLRYLLICDIRVCKKYASPFLHTTCTESCRASPLSVSIQPLTEHLFVVGLIPLAVAHALAVLALGMIPSTRHIDARHAGRFGAFHMLDNIQCVHPDVSSATTA